MNVVALFLFVFKFCKTRHGITTQDKTRQSIRVSVFFFFFSWQAASSALPNGKCWAKYSGGSMNVHLAVGLIRVRFCPTLVCLGWLASNYFPHSIVSDVGKWAARISFGRSQLAAVVVLSKGYFSYSGFLTWTEVGMLQRKRWLQCWTKSRP